MFAASSSIPDLQLLSFQNAGKALAERRSQSQALAPPPPFCPFAPSPDTCCTSFPQFPLFLEELSRMSRFRTAQTSTSSSGRGGFCGFSARSADRRSAAPGRTTGAAAVCWWPVPSPGRVFVCLRCVYWRGRARAEGSGGGRGRSGRPAERGARPRAARPWGLDPSPRQVLSRLSHPGARPGSDQGASRSSVLLSRVSPQN